LIVVRLGFGRWDVPDRPQQALVVEPVDPLERGQFDVLQILPGTAVNDFCLVETVDRFGQRVVVGIARKPGQSNFMRRQAVRVTCSDPVSERDFQFTTRAFEGDLPRSKVNADSGSRFASSVIPITVDRLPLDRASGAIA
jgi:hypothetical protein